MPRDISSSSSEDEADSPAAKSPAKQKEAGEKTTRYQCPSDFVSFSHRPCSSTLTESLRSNNSELWLLKAPAGFRPECFSGLKLPLSGLQTLKVPATAGGDKTAGGGRQIYSVLASSHGTSELRLLTSDRKSSDGFVFAPAFSGLLNVCECHGDSSANQAPRLIPAAPAPSIPPGLKQRFQPFGSKTPTLTCEAENETDAAAFAPSSTTRRPLVVKRSIEEAGHEEEEEEEEGRKKKKKKKKEKRIKMEQEEAVSVKQEPAAEIQDDISEEKRKKKKKKKDREREEEEEEEVKEEEMTVKCEPIDSSYGDVVEGSGKKKKKKKKKKNKTDDV